MKKTLLIALTAIMLASAACISFNTTGLKTLTPEQRQLITKPSIPIERLQASDTIYLVNDSIVKAFLADKEYAIVHSYLTWCKSKYCINPATAYHNLQNTGLPFLMIAGDFESKNGYRAPFPFLCIDFGHYKTKNYSQGIEKLYRALGCGEDWWKLYSLFHRGECLGSADTLDEIMQIYASRTP